MLFTEPTFLFLFLPVLLAYLIALSIGETAAGRKLLPCLAAVALALGLSAFFWLPAIAERGYDSAEVDAEIARDRAREQQLGIGFGQTPGGANAA